MSRSDLHRLVDIREQWALITRLVARGRNMERALEILGEAADTVEDATRTSLPDVDWCRISRLTSALASSMP